MYKIALFDFDGVLNTYSFTDFSKIGIQNADMQEFWLTEFKHACVIGKADTKEVVVRYFKQWGYTGTVAEFFTHWHESERHVYEDVLAEIIRLKNKGLPIYLATNQDTYRTMFIKKEMGLENIFNGIYASCTLGFAKPDPQFYTAILQDLQAKPEEVLYWDDSQKNIDAASILGIKSFIVKDTKMMIEELRTIQNGL